VLDSRPVDQRPVGGPVNQSLLFQRLRWHLLRNGLHVAVERSALRVLTIVGSSLVIWGGIFFLSMGGFVLLQHQLPLYGGIIGLLFDFLFLALTMLLVLSSGLILYSSLFNSPEATFLLCQPAAADQVFAFKYQGALAFSSWAFVLLGSPILLAYGLIAHVPWYFYVLLPVYFFAFILLPGSLGALLCLTIVNCAPRRPRQLLIAVAVLTAAGVVAWGAGLARTAWRDALGRDAVSKLLGQLTFAEMPLVPSHWMSRGLRAAAVGDAGGALYYLALVSSNGLFLYLVTAWAARRLYRRGYNRVATGGLLRRRHGGAWLDRTLTGLVGFLDPQTKLLIVKDFRTFRRDPAQWVQVLIFTGLLSLYFANIRRLYVEDITWAYQNSISLLNLTATAFLLCAYTGRFIFPMLSLEGRKFWILGLLPLQRERLLWGKFVFSATGGLLIAEFLILLGDIMLGMPWLVVGLHALTVAVLALGLSGLSVGLGACMPNFQENDPSKIAVGFGGTLNLVAGLVFLMVVIAVMATPWHLHAMNAREGPDFRLTLMQTWFLAGGVLFGIGIGAAAVVLPLWLGAQALRRMEF
jgi:ABC-2 type transport system permease protein